MRHLAYSVKYSVVPINSSPLTVTLYSSVITILIYNDTKYSVPFMTLQPSPNVLQYSLKYEVARNFALPVGFILIPRCYSWLYIINLISHCLEEAWRKPITRHSSRPLKQPNTQSKQRWFLFRPLVTVSPGRRGAGLTGSRQLLNYLNPPQLEDMLSA
jgi:hypothetical protein